LNSPEALAPDGAKKDSRLMGLELARKFCGVRSYPSTLAIYSEAGLMPMTSGVLGSVSALINNNALKTR
jgi:hypothetical protein